MSITEITVPLQEAAWLPWAVQYFFFIGISTTAALVAAVGSLGGGERWRRIQAPALLLALSATIVAPIALLADLQQPGRFWHFYVYFSPHSWMSIGAVLLPIYVASFFAFLLVWLRERLRASAAPGWLTWLTAGSWSGERLLPWLAGATAIAAIAILSYTGSEVMVVKARALWSTYWLPVNLLLTAMVGTLGAILFLQRWVTGSDRDDEHFTTRLFFIALLLTAAGALGWGITGWLFGSVSFDEAMRLFDRFGYWRFLFYGSSIAGLLLVAATMRLLRRPQLSDRAWLLGPVALLAAWSFRWAVLMNVQTVPKYGAGLYPYQLPLGSDGLLGILGTFGLWVAVLVIVTALLTWSPTAPAADNLHEVTHG